MPTAVYKCRSFIESVPLFGYDLADYEQLFEEKLELFSLLRDEKPVTWSGRTRAALQDAASVAGLLVTTEAMIAERPEKKAPAGPPGGGMGGMGDMDF